VNQRERNDLDRHITGNFGEDQFKEEIMTESQVAVLERRLLSFCNQLARDDLDPIREQIRELCNLARTGLSEMNQKAAKSKL